MRDQASGIRDQGLGIRGRGSGIRNQGPGISCQGSGIRDQGFWVESFEARVLGFGLRKPCGDGPERGNSGLKIRGSGLGFRIPGCGKLAQRGTREAPSSMARDYSQVDTLVSLYKSVKVGRFGVKR